MTPEQQKALAEFAQWCMQKVWSGWYSDLDGCDVFDKATELGLLEKTEYDPKIHGEDEDCEPGDEYYVLPAWLKEAAK